MALREILVGIRLLNFSLPENKQTEKNQLLLVPGMLENKSRKLVD